MILISVGRKNHALVVRVAEKHAPLMRQYGYLSGPKRLFEVLEIDHASCDKVGHADEATRVSE